MTKKQIIEKLKELNTSEALNLAELLKLTKISNKRRKYAKELIENKELERCLK